MTRATHGSESARVGTIREAARRAADEAYTEAWLALDAIPSLTSEDCGRAAALVARSVYCRLCADAGVTP